VIYYIIYIGLVCEDSSESKALLALNDTGV